MSLDRREFLLEPCCPALPAAASPLWRAGLAAVDITPPLGVWMGGYAARRSLPGHRAAASRESAGRRGLGRAPCGHRHHRCARPDRAGRRSHCRRGPAPVRTAARAVAALQQPHAQRADYPRPAGGGLRPDAVPMGRHPRVHPAHRGTGRRGGRPGARVDAAGQLRWAQGRAGFAANRRTAINPDGPVDHSVPVVAVERRDGSLAGLLFGYACHNTTLPPSFVSYHGDYAGVAKAELERRHPGVTALFIRAAAPTPTPILAARSTSSSSTGGNLPTRSTPPSAGPSR